jgi:hypothetical protein
MQIRLRAGGPVEDLFQRLDDTRFNLLVMGQPAPAAGLGDLLGVHAIPDDAANSAEMARVGITGPAFYLLRPDGYVGLAGTRFDADAVERYLAEHHIRVDGGNAGAAAMRLRAAA